MDFVEYLQQAAIDFGMNLNDHQLQQFRVYYQLLIEWNEKINLTAITAPEDVAVKHIIDSLSCYDSRLFPERARVIDVGTGAGFPGIPLKIYRPDLQITLLDSLHKRLVYLQEVIDQLSLQEMEIVHSRAEDAGREKKFRESFSIVTSRAVARLTILAELCLPFVAVGGRFLALKGKDALLEVDDGKKAIHALGGEISEVRPVFLPGLVDQRSIIIVRKLKSSPAVYPRRYAMIEKKPL